MVSIKAVDRKMQLDNTLLVCGQDALADFKKKKQTKTVGNQLIHKMDMLGIPRDKNWINRKQIKADIQSGKIHDNTADDDFGQYDVADSKKALKNPDNQFFELWNDGGADPYFDECNGISAISIYGDDIGPNTNHSNTGNDYIISHYDWYLYSLKRNLKTLAMEKHILQKTNNIHGYTKKLLDNKKYANLQAEKAKKHADKVASSVNSQLKIIKKMV